MTIMRSILGAAATLALTAAAAVADPAIIFDLGGKFDKSFNESAYTGAKRWADATGGSFKEIEMQSEAQREQALRRLAESGSNPVVMTGFAFGNVLNEVAPDYPDTSFVIIDMVVEQPNVRSVVFSEHEGSYLVGMMAANASKSGTGSSSIATICSTISAATSFAAAASAVGRRRASAMPTSSRIYAKSRAISTRAAVVVSGSKKVRRLGPAFS